MTGPLVDAALPWPEAHPYRLLAALGISPASSAREVLDASFDMTREQLEDPGCNAAWEVLRRTGSRLIVDFFCHPLPAPAPAAPVTDRTPLFIPGDLLLSLLHTVPARPRDPAGPVDSDELPPSLSGEPVVWTPGLDLEAEEA